MSFILDALKKAESERNRRVAPVLMDARVAPPRRNLPAWGWALGVVLVVNLAVLAWLLLRPSPPAAGFASVATTDPAPAPGAAPGPRTVPAPADVVPESPEAIVRAAAPPAEGELVISPGDVVIRPLPAPAPAAGTPPSPGGTAPGTAPDTANLPTLAQLRAAGISLPDLHLDLHIYDPLPAHRSVLVNGQRLVEGEYLPNGVKVERITADGVVLEAAGRRFRLDAS